MAGPKNRDIWQYGDFQTPYSLAAKVCALLARRGIAPSAIIEPSCGRGSFIRGAFEAFPHIKTLVGVEINADYAAEAKSLLAPFRPKRAQVKIGDFFATDWETILGRDGGPWLIVGNPPWVTNSDLGALNSSNLPIKSNFQGHRGLDAITGKANFDISEAMLLEQLSWLKQRSGWMAMLVKTSVARKILRHAWKRADPVGRAAIFKIDAMQYFGAAVDACLFVLPVNIGESARDCDVHESLEATYPLNTIGFHDDMLVANVAAYVDQKHLIGRNSEYIWRSGVKHDCSKVMELSITTDRQIVDYQGDPVCIEYDYLYPMLKSSDVAKGRVQADRVMIVTQKIVGADTSEIAYRAPKTWDYLLRNGSPLDNRGSVIYRKNPRFSVFGVGDYTFAPWKVAVSGFYKNVRFVKVGSVEGRPTIFDDTVYFLPCWSEEEADFILSLVQSEPYSQLLGAMIFQDEKRPVTAELLKRVSLKAVANELGLADSYERHVRRDRIGELNFA